MSETETHKKNNIVFKIKIVVLNTPRTSLGHTESVRGFYIIYPAHHALTRCDVRGYRNTVFQTAFMYNNRLEDDISITPYIGGIAVNVRG